MTLPTEAELRAIKVVEGGPRHEWYSSGWMAVTYRSLRKEFPPLVDGTPDYHAAALWVDQNAPLPEHPVETEIAAYFEEPQG